MTTTIDPEIIPNCKSVYPDPETKPLGVIRCSNDAGHFGKHYSIPIEVLGEMRVFEWSDVITITGDLRGGGVAGSCTCTWEGEKGTNIPKVGKECMEHAVLTGHMLRPH